MMLNHTVFVSGPPKALDEDETEFLDNLEMVSTVLKDIYLLGMPASALCLSIALC